jgi:GNAT superfamily N-acetyltransferase
MTNAFSLRDARPDDAGDIARLVRDLAVFERLESEATATGQDFRKQLFGEHPVAHALVAERECRIVAIAIWFHNFSTFTGRPGLYLEDIYVEPEHRGLGIATAIFRALARRAQAAGCGRMEWSVLNWNENAIKFYRSLGAIGMDGWTVQRLNAESIARLAQEP